MTTFFNLVPRPIAIRISTNQTNPLIVRPIGSPVTLTCMADLDPAIDIPVTLNIQLRHPNGSLLPGTTPAVSQGFTYTTTSMIGSFGRSDSGVYNCTADVNSSLPNQFISNSNVWSGTLRVTIGESIGYIYNVCHDYVSS